MKITGVHSCNICAHEFEWEFTPRQRLYTSRYLDVEDFNEGVAHPSLMPTAGGSGYDFKVYCPACEYQIFFHYDP